MDTTNVLVSTIRGESSGTSHESLPSLYEVILVDQIDAMLKPAFRQFLSAATELIPASLFEWRHSMQEHWEEIYDVIILVVQYRLIRTQGSTLAERIYGLQRRGLSGGESFHTDRHGKPLIKASTRMSKWQNDVSIFLVAVLPRIVSILTHMSAVVRERRRARRQVEEAQRRIEARNAARGGTPVAIGEDAEPPDDSAPSSFQGNFERLNDNVIARLSRRAYMRVGTALNHSLAWLGEGTAIAVPFMVAGCGAVVTAQRLRYLFGHTPYHHPVLELTKTLLVRRNPELHSSSDTAPQPPGSAQKKPDWRLLAVLGTVVTLRIMHWVARQDDSNTAAIGAAAFATDGGRGGPHAPMADIPLPPPPPGVGRGCVVPPSNPEVGEESCPLCTKAPRVAECASTGGYLFCHECLLECLRRDRSNGAVPSCPVTGIPCEEKDIIIIH